MLSFERQLTHGFWYFHPDNLPDHLKVSLGLAVGSFPERQYSVVFGCTNARAEVPVLLYQDLPLS